MQLTDSVGKVPFIGPTSIEKLDKLGITTVEELLLHVPFRYLDFSKVVTVADATPNEMTTVNGVLTEIKSHYTKKGFNLQIGKLVDESGTILVVWFNQPFIVRSLKVDSLYAVSGKVDWYARKKAIFSPLVNTQGIIPIYHETKGVNSKWLNRRVGDALEKIEIADTELKNAIHSIHFPKNLNEAEEARKFLAFRELLALQTRNLQRKRAWERQNKGRAIVVNKEISLEFQKSLPFTLTNSQITAIGEIEKDLVKSTPMNRLLEGDVGSGKTIVAASACLSLQRAGLKSVILAPTQILANQHKSTLDNVLSSFGVKVNLVTSEVKGDTNLDSADVIVGTHSLLNKKLVLTNVGLVVIDEQHRFGVGQRTEIVDKFKSDGFTPHQLTMTATPIPRTVAMTFYGDVDLTTLGEIPTNRQKITTWVVPKEKREGANEWIEMQMAKTKSQAFIICPLIEEKADKIEENLELFEEPKENVKGAVKEFERLKLVFKNRKLGLLHGRLKGKEREEMLDDFRQGRIDMLVATPVVEVGIDIPNATIMVIENADRFGLAQLHQLRGRVGRGKKKSYCLLFTSSESKNTLARLNALKTARSGFELAEMDLTLRGPGEIFGVKQHGFPELKIANWTDTELMKKAKETAIMALT